MIERRYLPNSTAPVAVTMCQDGGKTISGLAAVFYRAGRTGTEYKLFDGVFERIRPAAFNRALKEKHDVRELFNHDADNLLGRVASGTCRLSVDSTGLRYEIDIDPNDPDHQRVLAKIARGDLTGSSFAFTPTEISWEDRDTDSIRWIEDADLYDVGPVTYPAYQSTTTGIRSETDAADETDWMARRLEFLKLNGDSRI